MNQRSCFLLSIILLTIVPQIAQSQTLRRENTTATTDQGSTRPINNSSQAIQNPSNPTGPNMKMDIDFPARVQTLTPDIVNSISKSLGIDTSGNSQLVNPTDPTSQTAASMPTNRSNAMIDKPPANQPVIPAAGPITPKNLVDAATQTTEPAKTTQPSNNSAAYSLFDNASTIKIAQLKEDIKIPNNLTYVAQDVDRLQNYNKTYQQIVAALRTNRSDFQGKIVYVQSADLKDVGTVYQLYYHFNGNIYAKVRIIVRLNQVVRVDSAWQALDMPIIKITPTRLKTPLDQIDLMLRRVYKDFINSTVLEASEAHQFTRQGFRVYFLNYTDKSVRSEVIAKQRNGIYTIISFRKNGSVKASYTILPTIAWRKMQEYQTVNWLVSDYATRKATRNISVLSVSAYGHTTGDRIRFCNSYMVQNNFTTACSSINILSRNASLDYFRMGIISTEPSSDQFYEQEYSEMITDPVLTIMDTAAKQQFGHLIKDSPISKVELKVSNTGKSYRLTYQTEKYNVVIGYNQPAST